MLSSHLPRLMPRARRRHVPRACACLRAACASRSLSVGGAKRDDEDCASAPSSLVHASNYNVPNAITLARIVATPYVGWLVVDGQFELATWGFALAGVSDFLDGFIAKRFNQRTVFGSFLDPIADKIFVSVISLACWSGGLLPAQLVCTMLARDVVLVGGAFWLRAKTKSAAADFFDTTEESAFEVKPDLMGKCNTVLQFSLLGVTLCNAAWGLDAGAQLDALCWVVGATTVASGVRYGAGFLAGGRAASFRPLKHRWDTWRRGSK